MKKLFKVLVFLVFLAVIGFAAAMFFTSDLTDVANNFFTAIKNGDYSKAQMYVSNDFKRVTSVSALKKVFPYNRFRNYSGCSFSSREKNADGTAKLKGKIEFSDGSSMPVEIVLVKEGEEWKINYISLSPTGVDVASNSNNSSDSNYNFLVKKTMDAIVDGILNNDYSKVYMLASDNFKNQIPKERLASVFKRFASVNINWNDIDSMQPVIKRTNVLENGVLRVEGYYPTSPKKVGFRFEYSKDGSSWKIEGLFLRFEK
ncbi:DUF4878 domain-containing protein [Hippea alviniae]|uniref:DUF4878 domain-containing protein n=1 Tax=Hippea alviniae TaxID=1279027 RepID=UPI0003B6C2F5|nr:DUF4878 domain-containing protein [Hippea alviniae]